MQLSIFSKAKHLPSKEEKDKEIWKDINDYEGYYQVSNLGRVRSLDRTIICSLGKKYHRKGKVLSLNKFSTSGYRICMLTKGEIRKNYFIHRLVAIHFIENPENKEFVNHKDNDKLNNDLLNLEWSTPLENTRHAHELNVTKVGLEHYCSKLNRSQLKEIYRLASEENMSQKKIGELFNISQSAVSRIKNKKTYKKEIIS